ncbi:hypothetical protein [Thiobacillus sp.]|uniref:hypothetical protein n=1 Tax=Thiobacillus sp. TaxID=924 RepID=UPI0025FB9A5C|nr:hypothetical protein [Thiobacillus sp.]
MLERKGEKIGWTWGWIGGFLWVAIVGMIFLAQGRIAAGCTGLLVFVAAIWTTRRFAPWRHPTTPYWRLYLGLYLLLLLTILWAIWAFGGLRDEQFNGWMLLWLLPILTPMFINGRKIWAEGEPRA